jgi:hypothetical protein
MKFKLRFVDFIPDNIEEGVLYISLDYGAVIHKCACGCGSEVNTPLTPTGWRMIYNGETISLKPSVGNWSFDCKSHYWITNSKVKWALKWSDETIQKVRIDENSEREEYYRSKDSDPIERETEKVQAISGTENKSWFQRILFWK